MTVGRHPSDAPKVFISHASEDKENFVRPFATRLLAHGINPWVDEWEIQAGDSLVQRIFDEGIESADAFIAVISQSSVTKPWVREELDAGVVRRINSQCRLMPVLIDDAAVPASLRHILWLSVPKLGLEGVAAEVTRILHGRSSAKPQIGAPPAFLVGTKSVRLASQGVNDPADRTVLGLLIAELRRRGLGAQVMTSDPEFTARRLLEGIDEKTFDESMEVLVESRVVKARKVLASSTWWVTGVSPQTWLDAAAAEGLDIAAVERLLLNGIVNEDRGCVERPAEYLGIDERTASALLHRLQTRGLIRYSDTNHGPMVWRVNPTARRAARDL